MEKAKSFLNFLAASVGFGAWVGIIWGTSVVVRNLIVAVWR